jgi:hypothetical protein
MGMPQYHQLTLTKRVFGRVPSHQAAALNVLNMPNPSMLFASVDIWSDNLVSGSTWDDPIETTGYEGTPGFLRGTMPTQGMPTQVEDTVEQLILTALISWRNPESAKLAKQLSRLQKDIQEENDQTCPGISVPSLKAFLTFLEAHEDLRLPIVSATPECNIYAAWRTNHDHVFSIHFLREDNVRFVIFRPNEKHPDRTVRISGMATADIVFDIAASHGVRNWVCK